MAGLTAIGALVLLSLGYILYYRQLHPLSKYPGPFLASLTNFWKFQQLYSLRSHQRILQCHDLYGPIVRIGPNDLSFNSANAIGPIYKSGGRLMPKSDFYKAFVAIEPNLFGTTNETHHALRRRQLSHGFSASSLKSMESIFNTHITHLVSRVNNAADQHVPLDLKDVFAFYAYDVTGQLAFDSEFNSQILHDPSDLPPINAHFFLGNLQGCFPEYLPYVRTLSSWFPWVQRLQDGRVRLAQMARGFVQHAFERHKQSDSTRTLLTSLLNARDQETGRTLSLAEINSEAFGFLVAGSHTTSATLTILFYHLLKNQSVLDKIVKELDQLDHEANEDIYEFSGLEAKLPYTTACIREGFRIDPIGAFPTPRCVMHPEGLDVGGERIPQGTNCTVINHVLHHNPAIWGADHAVFNPNRFTPDSPDYDPAKVNLLMHFGIGHRACIGRNEALLSMYKIITTLLKNYRFELVDQSEVMQTVSYGMVEKEGPLIVRVEKRTRRSGHFV